MTELVPVNDEDTGELLLFDIFVDGVWCGSRRTQEQCGAYLLALSFAYA